MFHEPLPYSDKSFKHPYEKWVEDEGMPFITGYAIEDLRTVPLGFWERLGLPAAFIHLKGGNGYVGALVAEIPPGGQSKPIRHLYEQQILILDGRGVAQFWTGEKGTRAHTVEWQTGSLFSPPLNVWYQLYNGSGTETARIVCVNNAPMMANIFRGSDFIFNTPFEFTDRFDGREDYFSTDFKASEEEDTSVNFIPDVYAVPLTSYEDRGRGYSRLGVNLSGNRMAGHIGAFEVGTYKKAHRHGGGAQVIILGGQGFSLMWPRDGDIMRVDWKPGSLLVPPEGWYHNHFNTGPEPARVLALRRGFRGLGPVWYSMVSIHAGGHQLEYADEPPEIRPMYEADLAKNGVKLNMPPIVRP